MDSRFLPGMLDLRDSFVGGLKKSLCKTTISFHRQLRFDDHATDVPSTDEAVTREGSDPIYRS